MVRHKLDIEPVVKAKTPLYINEPWLVDLSIEKEGAYANEPEPDLDNIRVYVPLDISHGAILRRLRFIIGRYGELNELNEMNFRMDVEALVSQIEIYDQVWYVRHMPDRGRHSVEAVELVREVVRLLEGVSDGCGECFPFELIEKLKREYLV